MKVSLPFSLTPPHALESQRLRLVCCDAHTLEAVLAGDAAIARKLGIRTAPNWTEFGEPAFRFSLANLMQNPLNRKWLCYLPILRKDNMLVGSGGYKGAPDADGWVEIGYEIAKGYRRLGLATEMAQLLANHAFTHSEIKGVRAHTLAATNSQADGSVVASGAVLAKLGFRQVEQLLDPEDGPITRWERKR